jgi:hypothetical protein
MSHSKRDPKSPYARYNKRPYRYSDAFEHWSAAAKSPNSDDEERANLARKHSILFLGFDPKAYPNGRYPV